MEKDLSKICPFRIRDKKTALKLKLRYLKYELTKWEILFVLKRIFHLNIMYVIQYKDEKEAKEAWFMYQRCKKDKLLLKRHEKIWKTKFTPSFLTVLKG